MCLACFSSPAEFLKWMVKSVQFLSRLLNASCTDVITVPLFFSLLPNHPRPLSSLDTHARWQPVTQSAQSRWSYGKIEDCEQSIILCIWFCNDVLVVLQCAVFRAFCSVLLSFSVFSPPSSPLIIIVSIIIVLISPLNSQFSVIVDCLHPLPNWHQKNHTNHTHHHSLKILDHNLVFL